MRILIAEDNEISRRMLQHQLSRLGHEVVACADGATCLEVLERADAPRLVVLDWMMPGLTGVEVCRRIRESPRLASTYVILVTARAEAADVVTALDGGADDHMPKPYDPEELRARIRVGERILGLQRKLADQVRDLESALARIKTLEKSLSICSYCKCIREEKNSWRQIEAYIADHTNTHFSHGICPPCFAEHVKPDLDAMAAAQAPGRTPS